MAEQDITYEMVRNVLTYEPDTGLLRWLKARGGMYAGAVAGCLNDGYVVVNLYREPRRGHRIAWLLHHGEWPKLTIDHINGVRHDNRLLNLREATHFQQMQNRRFETKNGLPNGVSRSRRRFLAQIQCRGQKYYLGSFDTPELAGEAYRAGAKKMFGEFAFDWNNLTLPII